MNRTALDTTRPRARLALPVLGLLAAAIVAGCGGDDDADPTTTTPQPTFITAAQGNSFKLEKDSRDDVLMKLGDPVLTAAPTGDASGGCVYYPIQNQPLSNVFLFCFDRRDRLIGALTQISQERPAPAGATPAREALIARGDTVCGADYSDLKSITREVGTALADYSSRPSAANRVAVGDAIARFIANLERTHAQLSAFDAPADEEDGLTGYLDSLQQQIATLSQARKAFLDGDLRTYDQLGDEFTEIGETAKGQAQEYGFTTCSASDFG